MLPVQPSPPPSAVSGQGDQRDEPDQDQGSSGSGDGSGSGSGGESTRAGARPNRTRDSHSSSSSGQVGSPRTYYECKASHGQGSNTSNSSVMRDPMNMLHSSPPSTATAEEILLTVSCQGIALAIHLPPPPSPPPSLPPSSAPLPASAPATALDGLERGVRSDSNLTDRQEQGPFPPSSSLDISQPINGRGSVHDVQRSLGTSSVSHSPFLALALASVSVPPPLIVVHPSTNHIRDVVTHGSNDVSRVMLHLDWDDITAWGYNSTSLRVQYSTRKTEGKGSGEEKQGITDTYPPSIIPSHRHSHLPSHTPITALSHTHLSSPRTPLLHARCWCQT